MKRPLRPEEQKVWSLVAGTVHPLPGRAAAKVPTPEEKAVEVPARIDPTTIQAVAKPKPRMGLDGIEPNRRHRIVRERDPIGARLDLHGMDQDRARSALESFLQRAWDEGYRSVLVITGKGVQGDGVLRRRAPEWLGAAHLSHIVAGISEAGRRHGGAGALYVALKRKGR
ncbi:Smr/MutS family protein [Phenylobacterium deserti]|uniref:DNA mismatch repair protein MutS n=1 Tax=Phenylobacterium deserti TaxID=1914756 RepID=A0A328AQM8_9CAUL|nr:Smr/MutS family protein [Phenylobacterium deserti]RAK57323.1 DNA mismatch repair protein MutS [Phenylobacterium deserti]